MTLYDFLPSGNGYKVRFTLRELGIRFTYRPVDPLAGETRQPWFLAKNPVGQVPVLELDDGTYLVESTAIMFHLAEGSDLLPSPGLARTRVLQWLCFEQTNIDGVISRARFRTLFPQAVPTRPDEFATWREQGTGTLALLDAHLTDRRYMVGERFTIADIAIFAYVHCAEDGGYVLSAFPSLTAWIDRVQARPGYLPIDRLPT